jgi:hypothetical protein
MRKAYSDYMNEISKDELYRGLLAYGMFSDKLPPIFSAVSFCDYCLTHTLSCSKKERHQLIEYEIMRNTNVPRLLGIPNPFSYHRLCRCLADHWDELCKHFETQTNGHKYKTSRIHIRKIPDREALFESNEYNICEVIFKETLFEMNFDDWRTDGNPEEDILVGKKWLVNADIATCFPSIYTHSLPWALVGKDTAKQERDSHKWYNKIDKCCQDIKDGETHGIPIGPHSSNLLAEIILTVIDHALRPKWEYIRNIDDYTCYVESREDADRFLTELNEELHKYDLILNHKKTKILELPTAASEHWVRHMEHISSFKRHVSYYHNSKRYWRWQLNYISVRSYFDSAIELMENNDFNSAILKFAIKVLAKQKLTPNAKKYCVKNTLHLAVIYPYLVPLLDSYVFEKYAVDKSIIEEFTLLVFKNSLRAKNYEALSFCVYFALKYDFEIKDNELTADLGINSRSCIFKVLLFLYSEKYFDANKQSKLSDHAKKLLKDKVDFERNWLFVYECLSAKDFTNDMNDWKAIKSANVSFITNIT